MNAREAFVCKTWLMTCQRTLRRREILVGGHRHVHILILHDNIFGSLDKFQFSRNVCVCRKSINEIGTSRDSRAAVSIKIHEGLIFSLWKFNETQTSRSLEFPRKNPVIVVVIAESLFTPNSLVLVKTFPMNLIFHEIRSHHQNHTLNSRFFSQATPKLSAQTTERFRAAADMANSEENRRLSKDLRWDVKINEAYH